MENVEKLADQSWEGCDGCTEAEEAIYKNGYVHGYNAAKGQVPEVRKMVEDDVEKLVREHFEKNKELNNPSSFKAGYNKAKETLYTEEEVIISMKYARTFNNKIRDIEFIQSLKQPKQ
jgi:hypothetical protein